MKDWDKKIPVFCFFNMKSNIFCFFFCSQAAPAAEAWMIYGADKAFCPLGQHRLSACYQCGACSRDYWGLEREDEEKKEKNLVRCNKSPFTPSFVRPPPERVSSPRHKLRHATIPQQRAR